MRHGADGHKSPLHVAQRAREGGHGLGAAVGDHEEDARLVGRHVGAVADVEPAALQLHHLLSRGGEATSSRHRVACQREIECGLIPACRGGGPVE